MKLYAVLGEKLSHTLSPQIHTYIFNKLNINGNYSVIEARRENISKIIESANILGYSGINVTIPYKELIMPYLDEVSKEASDIGAVNTVMIKDGKSYGYNTDYFGFGSMLCRAGLDVTGKDVVIFGAGGAAKALIAYLHDSKAKSVLVASGVKEELAGIKKHYNYVDTCELRDEDMFRGDILVNATPVGMFPNVEGSIVSEDVVKRFKGVVDIVYNPLETKLLHYANKNGIVSMNGLYMLIDQAIKAEEIFQDCSIDLSVGNEIYDILSKHFTITS